jgi:hypothetical protein
MTRESQEATISEGLAEVDVTIGVDEVLMKELGGRKMDQMIASWAWFSRSFWR